MDIQEVGQLCYRSTTREAMTVASGGGLWMRGMIIQVQRGQDI